MARSAKSEVDAWVFVALAQHPVGHAGVDQQPDAVALKDARPVGVLDLVATTYVEHHRVDAGPLQKVRQHEPGRSGADDPDLGARHTPATARMWATDATESTVGKYSSPIGPS